MAQIHPAWLEHQRKRFTRPDAHRYWRPDAAPAAGDLTDASFGEQLPMTSNHISRSDRAELLALKSLLVSLRWQLALRRFERKYRADQARDGRGRWTNEEGGAESGYQRADETLTDVSAARKIPPVVKEFGQWTARQFVSKYCEGRVNRELPSQFEDMTIDDIWKLARGGDARARTCLKLMQPRFRK